MGKAALDLPDPLQAAPGEARTSADDLLAQLAGDEIDRRRGSRRPPARRSTSDRRRIPRTKSSLPSRRPRRRLT